MTTLHEKSPCCRGKIARFGGRRRQCLICHGTWRVWKRRRGRTKKRKNYQLLHSYLDGQFVSMTKEAKRRGAHESSLRRTLKNTASQMIETVLWQKPARSRTCILLADAVIKYIRGKWYTVYLTSIKDCKKNKALLLPPVLRQEKETVLGWRAVLNSIPDNTWKNVKILVCDGHRGLVNYAHHEKVEVQRCQAHLIMAIAGRRSRSPFGRHRNEGDRMYNLAKTIFRTTDPQELKYALDTIEAMGWETKAKELKTVISGFVKSYHEYRTYIKYPKLRIPTTNNAMESFIGQFQEICHRARGFSSPDALFLWITAFAKHKKEITCNGFYQPN